MSYTIDTIDTVAARAARGAPRRALRARGRPLALRATRHDNPAQLGGRVENPRNFRGGKKSSKFWA